MRRTCSSFQLLGSAPSGHQAFNSSHFFIHPVLSSTQSFSPPRILSNPAPSPAPSRPEFPGSSHLRPLPRLVTDWSAPSRLRREGPHPRPARPGRRRRFNTSLRRRSMTQDGRGPILTADCSGAVDQPRAAVTEMPSSWRVSCSCQTCWMAVRHSSRSTAGVV